MCGIQINKKDIKNQIKHRGVEYMEGELNFWYYKFSSLPLASNNTGLKQPLKTSVGLVLFNGEIFNYKEFGNYSSDLHYLEDVLSNGLGSSKFLKQYKKWDGFWAICIINRNVLFFTDPLGKKQLYYSKLGICSEIKPLLDKDSLIMQEPRKGTLNTKFSNVYRAMAGKFYEYHYNDRTAYGAKIKVKNYTEVEPQEKNIYELMDSSVKTRAVTRYGKLGILFSGGLDSSIVAYHLLKNKIDFTAISIENNESEYCEKVSKALGFDVIYIDNQITEEEKIKIFKSYEHALDMGSVIPQYLLFKKCRELELHTVITGDGADELFGGYTRALTRDTFNYDVFKELPYYHHIRIDRCSMANTVEARNPFLSSKMVQLARKLKNEDRKGKRILKDIYRDKIPFVDRKKIPLRPMYSKEENINIGNKYFDYAFKK